MAKTGGLADNFYVAGWDLSGDVPSIDKVNGGPALGDFTTINQSAHSRQGLLRDGGLDFTTFLDPVQSHLALKGLPTADALMTYFRGQAVGNPAACLNAKQVGYDPTRANDGSILFKVAGQGSGFGLEWGQQLTAGIYVSGNSTFEGGTNGWATGGGGSPGNCTVAQTTAQAHSGTHSLAITSVASGTMSTVSVSGLGNTPTLGFYAVPGATYTLGGWFRSAVSVRACAVGVQWTDASGNSVAVTFGSTVNDSTSAWTQATASLVPPAGAVWGRICAEVVSTGGASEVHYLDDVTLSNGTLASVNNGASSAFGMQAYLQDFGFAQATGSDVTISLQDSADNVTFAALTGGGFTQITTSAVGTQRIATANTATVRQYVEVALATTGGYGQVSFAVAFMRNPVAGVTF